MGGDAGGKVGLRGGAGPGGFARRRCRAERRVRSPSGRALVLTLLAVAGCASPVTLRGGMYHHTDRDYAVRAPGGSWSRISHERADLAFRGPGGAVMAMTSRCGSGTRASPAILARKLLIGLDDYRVRNGGPVSIAGRDGWRQTVETVQDGETVHLKTVTTKSEHCVYDFVLTAGASFEEVEPDFDVWWSSFHFPSRDGAHAERTP